jgi:hypothetical protein
MVRWVYRGLATIRIRVENSNRFEPGISKYVDVVGLFCTLVKSLNTDKNTLISAVFSFVENTRRKRISKLRL